MRRALLLGLLALAPPRVVGAVDVTEGAFLAGVTPDHPAIRALEEDLARAEAARRRAGLVANPRVEFWREQPEANPRLTNWSIGWTPPLDGRYGLGKRAADAGLAATREGLAVRKARLRQGLRGAFADWSLAHERRRVLARQLDLVAVLAEQERQRARLGVESGLSARRLALAKAEARAALREAEADLARAEAAARGWRPGLPPDAQPAAPDLAEPPAPADPLSSPELRSLQHEVEQAGLEERRAKRFWGFPTLSVGWQQLELAGATQSGPLFGASWTVPLFDRDQAARREASRLHDVAQARLRQAEARVAGEVEGGLAAYRALFTAAREAREAAAETDRVVEAATAAYRAGEADLTTLLESLRAAFGALLGEIGMRGQALEAHRALEAALGQPLATGGSR